jgi:hypothetical protein
MAERPKITAQNPMMPEEKAAAKITATKEKMRKRRDAITQPEGWG